ncbi:aspartyl/asparaginyl beta-hydroxylase domain-containing protein [Henriciella mobilis]|uniref:aspartyl/asparaginyl beta-hydroxylase domain-containing protein n=1 Tax=Henriciella mobilis TaxID=2305467 RepID=UPI0013148680|nr:aspartyl/asparaginyl beta-hydroxylase domain-containing protein [Henriciella mobilis]
MQNFRLIEEQVSVSHLLAEINAVENAWDLNQGRQSKIKVQREAQAIPIRGLRKSKIAGRKRWDVHESRYTNISRNFPKIRSCLVDLASKLNGELSRAKVAKLTPGARVYPHIDRGEYYRVRDRYHLVFDSEPGNVLRAGDEELWMKPGELWWFDNKAVHAAENASASDRIHFIFDLLPL